MASLEVAFEVPHHILQGLTSGTLERVGGVIRDTASKQVVTWLRDSNVLQNITNLPQIPFPNPLNLVIGAAQVGARLLDGHLTRDAIGGVSSQVQEVHRLVEAVSGQVAGVSQQVSSLAMLNTFMAGGQVLNFALSSVSLYATMKRFDHLSRQVDAVGALVRAEFNRQRDLDFKTALQSARDVFESKPSGYRDATMTAAIEGLFQARIRFVEDYEAALKDHQTAHHLMLAQQSLIRALYAEISRVRCYLFTGDVEMARRRLLEDREQFREAVVRLVKLWLGSYPALYFHKDVPVELLNRFLVVQHWLASPDDMNAVNKHEVLASTVLQYRTDFWNDDVVQDDVRNWILKWPNERIAQKVGALANDVAHAELLIENYQHLLGFELELAALRLSSESWEDWENRVQDADLEKHGAALIIDQEALDQATWRLSL
ncbi:MAG: hypothetical protein HC828_07170 [Blastochloris sp.]|nr:hypothetical protein [Blastochloris sp.]